MAFHEYPYTDFHEMNLDWILQTVKQLTEDWAQVRSDWEDEQAAFADLQSYIENYFNNLDVQQEINVKLDGLVLDGTMSELIAPYVASGLPAEVASQLGDVVAAQIGAVVAAQIGAVVADQLPAIAASAAATEVGTWLSTHIDPDTGYVIDDSLTVQGAAADAKTTGDEVTAIKSALTRHLNVIKEMFSTSDFETGSFSSAGNTSSSAKAVQYEGVNHVCLGIRTKDFLVIGDKVYIGATGTKYVFLHAWNKSDDSYVGWWDGTSFDVHDRFYANAYSEVIDIATMSTTYPSYKFKLNVFDISTESQLTVADGVSALYYLTPVMHDADVEAKLDVIVPFTGRWVNGGISTSTGNENSTGDSTKLRTNNFFKILNTSFFVYVPAGYSMYVMIYNASKEFVTATERLNGTTTGLLSEIQITSGYFIKGYIFSNNLSDITPMVANMFKLYYKRNYVKTLDDTAELQTDFCISMFEKVGVIGDSFASGALFDPITSTYKTSNYALSWPQIIARQNGISVTNFTEGGLYTKTWLTDADHGLPALLSAEKQNLYIINLGINDDRAIREEEMALGSIADVNVADYTQNPDTFFGNYGRIIGNILAYATKAKIVIMSVARESNRNMDVYIKQIADLYGIPYIDLTSDQFFVSEMYYSSIVNGHPLAYGYSGMAVSIQRLLEKCVTTNAYYFSDYDGAVS